jgi:hypothetical protein
MVMRRQREPTDRERLDGRPISPPAGDGTTVDEGRQTIHGVVWRARIGPRGVIRRNGRARGHASTDDSGGCSRPRYGAEYVRAAHRDSTE